MFGDAVAIDFEHALDKEEKTAEHIEDAGPDLNRGCNLAR